MRRRKTPEELLDDAFAEVGLKRIPAGFQKPTDPDIRRQWAKAEKALARIRAEAKEKRVSGNGRKLPDGGA